jgi:hypothetical protein
MPVASKSYKPKPKAKSKPKRTYLARPRAPLRGNGGYYDSGFVKTARKWVPKGTFSNAGRIMGGPLGGFAGSALAKLAGFGGYRLKQNSLIGEGESPAVMHADGSKMVVRHREYIMDIVSSPTANTFYNQSIPIQPGLPASFPWLAPISQQFEKYRPMGMVYEFKSLSADAISSGQANMTIGGVIMATNYNSASANFVNKQQMDNCQYSTSCKPSESFYHPIECNPDVTPLHSLYVRSGAVPYGQDQKTYDLGNFQIASFGIAASSVVLGELWCSYDIVLETAIATNALGQDVLSDHLQLLSVTNAAPLGGINSQAKQGSSLNGTVNSAGTTYSFPSWVMEGTFQFTYWVKGGNAATTPPSITYTNAVGVPIFNTDLNSTVTLAVGSNVSNFFLTGICAITGPNAQIIFGTAGTLPLSITVGDFMVTQFDSDVYV